jgi:hypothetical protein
MSEPTKKCSKCDETKPICEFPFIKKAEGIYNSQCTECKYYPKPKDGSTNRKCIDCGELKHYKNEFPASNACCKPCFAIRKKKRDAEKEASSQTQLPFQPVSPVVEEASSQTQLPFQPVSPVVEEASSQTPVETDEFFMQGVCHTIIEEEPTHKPCERCQELRLLTDYHVNNQKQCRFCVQVLKAERMESVHEFLKEKWKRAKDRAKKKNIEFTITFGQWKYIYFTIQQGLCALCGLHMTHKASDKLDDDIERFPLNISPDRKDSTKGYTYENVQFVRWCLNSAKNDMEQEAFIQMCGQVWEYHKMPKEPHWTPEA